MKEDGYNNSNYWLGLHRTLRGSLRSVGWPSLSEEFNLLKYKSEASSFEKSLKTISQLQVGKQVSLLEIGAGVGFFTNLTKRYAFENSVRIDYSVLDISPEALELIHDNFPDVCCIESDLTSFDEDSADRKYDMVTAIMVLLHLTDFEEYMDALKFCAASVDEGGHLIIYEPLLFREYAPSISYEFSQFKGSSVPRLKFSIDNILNNLGFDQVVMIPGASWLLNSPIQSGSRSEFLLKKSIWKLISVIFYRSDNLTRLLGPLLYSIDAFLKRRQPDSGTFVVYQKRDV